MEPETVHVPSPWTKSATPCVISSGSSDVLSDQRWKSRPDLVFRHQRLSQSAFLPKSFGPRPYIIIL